MALVLVLVLVVVVVVVAAALTGGVHTRRFKQFSEYDCASVPVGSDPELAPKQPSRLAVASKIVVLPHDG